VPAICLKNFQKRFSISLPLIISNVAQVGLGADRIAANDWRSADYRQLALRLFALNVIAIP